MKFLLINSLFLTSFVYANQQANFIYNTYFNDKLENSVRGYICASLPRAYLRPLDEYQPHVLLDADKAKIIDWRLFQVTEVKLSQQPLYKLIIKAKNIHDICLTQNNYKYCIKFDKVVNTNCLLDVKIPANFDYIRSS